MASTDAIVFTHLILTRKPISQKKKKGGHKHGILLDE